MFDKFIKDTVEKSVKKEDYLFSNFLVATYNRLNIPINPLIFNTIVNGENNAINGAILSGDYKAVRTFLINGAKLDLNVEETVSCLNIAISKKDIKMLKVLVDHIYGRSIIHKTEYDKEVSKLLIVEDITKKSPLLKAIDLFVESNDEKEKETLKECMKLIYNNPLFDKNNSDFYNKIWKSKSNYFIDYDERVLNSVENYVVETKNEELIKFFVDNGLNYVNKAILCVNPKLYSHAAMILKFNKPISFKDSNKELAGLLYSFESKVRMDNIEPTFYSKRKRFMEKVGSFISPCDAYMKRLLLTPEDMANMEKDDDNIYNYANVSSKDVEMAVSNAYKTISRLKRIPKFSNICQKKLLSDLTTDIEDISYMFSLYTKDANNFVAKDKITKYDFIEGVPQISIERDTDKGHLIYDFIWKKSKEMGLSYKQKISVIEEFLNMECLKILRENNIIKEDSKTFEISDFSKFEPKLPNDLYEKYYYPQTFTFNLDIDPSNSSKREDYKTAMCGYKMVNLLEQYNINVTKYAFFENNCITTLKKVLSECGYKKQLEEADRELNDYQKVHPQSVINRLRQIGHNTKLIIDKL